MTARLVMSDELGVSFFIDERFADTGLVRDEELPTAHFIASVPGEGWIAALSIISARAEPPSADEWLASQLLQARVAFGAWSAEAHEMLVAPAPAELAGCPALHIRYRLLGGGGASESPLDAADPVPASLVEHWTVLVEERRWLLAMELMVQPPEQWEAEREALELPFRTLELV